MAEETQTIYGFQTLLKGYAPSTFNKVYESKKDLIDFITTKDAIVKDSTFEMNGDNDSYFNEVSDVISKFLGQKTAKKPSIIPVVISI